MNGLDAAQSARTLAVLTAALCAAAGLWLFCGQQEALRRAQLLLADDSQPCRAPTGWPWRQAWGGRVRRTLGRCQGWLEQRLGVPIGREALCLPAGLTLALLVHSPLPAIAGAVGTPLLGRRLRAREQRREAERWREAVSVFCASLAGDLRAGLPPAVALAHVADALRGADGPGGPRAAETAGRLLAAARFGGDAPTALRDAARVPGAEGLAAVAACWEVAVDGGAGLADGLDRVAAALRAECDQREDLRAQLAGPRSTAAMLALLPVFGVGLGSALGADPLRVLLHTPAGLGCLLIGVLLEWAGLLWTARIVRAAEEA